MHSSDAVADRVFARSFITDSRCPEEDGMVLHFAVALLESEVEGDLVERPTGV